MYLNMECHPMFTSVYISLILMTAGFVLTLCSWLAPPLNDVVACVRIAGLASLFVGSVLLSLACLVGSFYQGKCFPFCYVCETKRPPKGAFLARSIESPFLTTAILGSTLCTEGPSDDFNRKTSTASATATTASLPFDDNDPSAIVIANKNVCVPKTKCSYEKPKRKRDYHLLPTRETLDYSFAEINDQNQYVHNYLNGEQESSFMSPNSSGTPDDLNLPEYAASNSALLCNKRYDEPPAYRSVMSQPKLQHEISGEFLKAWKANEQGECFGNFGQTQSNPLLDKDHFKSNRLESRAATNSRALANKDIKMNTFPTVITNTAATLPVFTNNNHTPCYASNAASNDASNASSNASSAAYNVRTASLKKYPETRCNTSHPSSVQATNSQSARNRTEQIRDYGIHRNYSNSVPTFQGKTNSVQIKIYEKYDSNTATISEHGLS